MLSTFALPIKEKKQTICLNMIVKNESKVILRCLNSVKHLIDYWVIVDTGSTDGTQKMIREHLTDIQGELHERIWKNFAHNRNEALELAKNKADYLLIIDADDWIEFDEGCSLPNLTLDAYHVVGRIEDVAYLRHLLIKASLPWKWEGVVHECLTCPIQISQSVLKHVRSRINNEGHNDPNKLKGYINLLEDALQTHPDDQRSQFYLAGMYVCIEKLDHALEWYLKRVSYGGNDEEVFNSLLQIGLIQQTLKFPLNQIIESLQKAHQCRPHRAEPVYYLAELYNQEAQYSQAYDVISKYQRIPKPQFSDSLYVHEWINNYGLLYQLATSCYHLGLLEDAQQLCIKLLAIPSLPKEWKDRIDSLCKMAKAQVR